MRLATLLLVIAAAILGIALWLVRQPDEKPVITVSHAWTRPVSTANAAAAVYFEIDNNGEGGDQLTGAQTPVAEKAEMHTSQMQGDVMQMRSISSVDIHADEHMAFSPGGLHLMLTGVKNALAEGDHFPLTLEFGKTGTVTIDVAVTEKGLAAPGTPMGDKTGDKGMGDMPMQNDTTGNIPANDKPMGDMDHGAAAHP
ncbi:MAG: copper chaperone PCu(A)C [Alphaproteobacteria bacterium]